MTKPRSSLVSLSDTLWYHVVCRCVRRAFLCGEDRLTGQNFEHRRGWIVDRVKQLAGVFAIDVAAYAVMSNHYHLVLRVDAERAQGWSNEEALRRWTQLFDGPLLVQRLVREGMPLTVCPLSNVKLCVFRTMADHNLPALLAAGLCATVNSDDPAYFGGYINTNFVETFAALPQLGAREAYQLARNSFEASFVDEAHKARWRAQLDATVAPLRAELADVEARLARAHRGNADVPARDAARGRGGRLRRGPSPTASPGTAPRSHRWCARNRRGTAATVRRRSARQRPS